MAHDVTIGGASTCSAKRVLSYDIFYKDTTMNASNVSLGKVKKSKVLGGCWAVIFMSSISHQRILATPSTTIFSHEAERPWKIYSGVIWWQPFKNVLAIER